MKNKIFLVIFITVSSILFGQEFLKEIELRNPVMYGNDIKELQSLLIRSGFGQIGEIDGYYGPRTADAIKTIQKFWGYDPTGIVNRSFWSKLFNQNLSSFLSQIGMVSRYNISEMDKQTVVRDKYTSRGGYLNKYFKDGILKKVEIILYARLYEERYEIFFVDESCYLILEELHIYHLPDNDQEMAAYKGFYDFLYSRENSFKSDITKKAYFADEDENVHSYTRIAEGFYMQATGAIMYIMHVFNSTDPLPSYKWEESTYRFKVE